MSRYYSPLRYPGGKNCIFPFVSNILYENGLIGTSYAEPYAGGAGLALRLLFEGHVEHIYINDLDKSIYAFWISILDRPDDFCQWLQQVNISIPIWNVYKEIQKNADNVETFELAKAIFFLNRTNISGVIKGGAIGGKGQKGKYKIDARFNKTDLIKRIKTIAGMRDRITVSNLDGISFVSELNRKKEEIFIYLDPPYYQKGADLYMNFYSEADHQKLSKFIHSISRKKWMISYDHHDFILNLYADKRKVVYKLSQSTSNRIGEEILVFSEKINFTQAIKSLKSPVLLETIV